MFSSPHWFKHRDPRALPEYHVAYQSEEYDRVMRHYGDVCHADLQDNEAFDRAREGVERVKQAVHEENRRRFVLRSIC